MFETGVLTCGCVKLHYEYEDDNILYFSDPEDLDIDDAYVVTDHKDHYRIFPTRACADAHAEKIRRVNTKDPVVVYPYFIGKKLMIRHFLKCHKLNVIEFTK